MKLVTVANESWWVPARAPERLAVQIENPGEYHRAIRDKLEGLIEAAGEEGPALVRATLQAEEIPGLEPESYDPETLAWALLRTTSWGELVREGDPERCEPATEQDALYAIEEQEYLTLADWLA